MSCVCASSVRSFIFDSYDSGSCDSDSFDAVADHDLHIFYEEDIMNILL